MKRLRASKKFIEETKFTPANIKKDQTVVKCYSMLIEIRAVLRLNANVLKRLQNVNEQKLSDFIKMIIACPKDFNSYLIELGERITNYYDFGHVYNATLPSQPFLPLPDYNLDFSYLDEDKS